MAESTEANLDQAENDKVVSKVEKFLRDGCGCSRGINCGQCSQQFLLEAVMVNVNNCLEPSHTELDLVVLANIQAFTCCESTGEKRKRSPRCKFTVSVPSYLQGNVPYSLHNELLAVSTTEGTL